MLEPENPWASAGRIRPRYLDGWSREALAGCVSVAAFAVLALVFAVTGLLKSEDHGSPREIALEEAMQAAVAREKAIFANYDSALARTECEAMVRAHATRPSSFHAGWSYGERRDPNAGIVSLTNTFRGRNAFNAELEGSYRCLVDASTNAVVGLEATSPDGKLTIVPYEPG